MARTPKGKPLTLRPVRLDDDVWAECRRLGKGHGTINEGLRFVLLTKFGDGSGTLGYDTVSVFGDGDGSEPERVSGGVGSVLDKKDLPKSGIVKGTATIYRRPMRVKGDKVR